jgi:hypothetical protein
VRWRTKRLIAGMLEVNLADFGYMNAIRMMPAMHFGWAS